MTRPEQLPAAQAAGQIVTALAVERVPGDAVRAIGTVERDELEGRLLWVRPRQEALEQVLLRLPELDHVVSADVVFRGTHRPTVDQLIAVWGTPETSRPDDAYHANLMFTVTAADGRRAYVTAQEPEADAPVDQLLVVLP